MELKNKVALITGASKGIGKSTAIFLAKEEEKELEDGQLINRFITADEIADGILFLVKNDAVCGEVLTVDGG